MALVLGGCSSSSKKGDTTKQEDGGATDGGAPTAANWSSQGFDVQSTWKNPGETKISTDNVNKLSQLWSASLGMQGTATIVGNRVYGAAPAGVSAVDADTGVVYWTASGTPDQGIGTTSSPTYDNGVLYVDNGSGGIVFALDATDGHTIWQQKIEDHPLAAGYSTPIVYKDRIYVGDSSNEELGTTANATFRGAVVCLNKADGSIVWKTNTAGVGENGAAVWSTVSLDPTLNLVFAGTGNNYTENPGGASDSIFAFDMDTGEVKWRKQVTIGDVFTISNPRSPDTDFGANPVVVDVGDQKLLVAGQKSGDIYTFDRTDGTQLATRKLGGGSAFIGGVFQAIAFDGKHVLVVNNQTDSMEPGSEPSNGDSSGTSVLFALDPVSLDIVWERQLPAWVWAPLTIANGVGYVGAETHLEAFNIDTGEKLFDYQAAGTIIGAPIVSNGRVYVPSGLEYAFGHADDQLHAFALPDDPAVGKQGGGTTGPTGPLDPTFTNVYKTIVAKNCIQSQCHGSTRQGNLFMADESDAYKNLVGVQASGVCVGPDAGSHASCACGTSGKTRVVAGDPDQSLLIQKLGGNPSCGDRMPPTGDVLPDDQQKLVKDWITAGANND
jgi:polyvinyl alcohol dehydrogenase (cytochrome)